jgi:hypothetical protein
MKDGRCYSGRVCVDSGARTNSPKKNNNTCQPASNTCIPFYDACPVGCSGDSTCQARCIRRWARHEAALRYRWLLRPGWPRPLLLV